MKTTTLLLSLGLITSSSATVLTFSTNPASANGSDVPIDYGDRVTSTSDGLGLYGSSQGFTPNILTDFSGNDASLWTSDYSDLSDVYYNETEGGDLSLNFQADPGFLVRLHSFDIGAWQPGSPDNPTIDNVTVSTNGIVLFTMSNVIVSETTATNLVFPVPLAAENLSIVLDTSGLGNSSDNIALDNVTFSQAAAPVPEPSSSLLLVGALAISLGLTRCRSNV